MYNLPDIDFIGLKNKIFKGLKNQPILAPGILILAGLILVLSIANAGSAILNYFPNQAQQIAQYLQIPSLEPAKSNDNAQSIYDSAVSYEQAVISAVKSASPSVVSIVISKNLPVYEQQYVNPFGDLMPGFNIQVPQYVQKGTKLQEIGSGSGFIVSADGLVLTNKHVVSDSAAEYTVFTNDGQKYSAKVLALDPMQDLAVIKIQSEQTFLPIKLGDSSQIQIGQTAIAIGNALGEFTNTVSVGVVSGLQRTISASDRAGGSSETLQGIIQTDAAINSGNSGGPLLNLKGEVIGINTAMAENAQSIGFAIPINTAKNAIDQVIKTNKIVYPFLGVRYVLVDSAVQKKYNLKNDYGALVLKGANGEPAVTKDSPAEASGIKENDVILELNGEKITTDNPLSQIITKYKVEDKVNLKILRDDQEQNIEAVLAERK